MKEQEEKAINFKFDKIKELKELQRKPMSMQDCEAFIEDFICEHSKLTQSPNKEVEVNVYAGQLNYERIKAHQELAKEYPKLRIGTVRDIFNKGIQFHIQALQSHDPKTDKA